MGLGVQRDALATLLPGKRPCTHVQLAWWSPWPVTQQLVKSLSSLPPSSLSLALSKHYVTTLRTRECVSTRWTRNLVTLSICLPWRHMWGVEVEPSWNVIAHGDAREGKWRGNWRMEWVASTLQTTSEHGVSSITTADAHASAASSRLNWCPCRFKWTRPFCHKTKSGFCTCAITFQMHSTNSNPS